ncbi:putative SUN domain-containing protein 1 [Hypsibius exemplaris]|uniref:SUN domain-containing protein 1 n=1 Tax=Hypsibius exemplaris TaxID=2072580 RepID=A0A1W0WA46_HYPEX|nr:putative SUN domain-containing protein 1 [Hypsibius exemplaris]
MDDFVDDVIAEDLRPPNRTSQNCHLPCQNILSPVRVEQTVEWESNQEPLCPPFPKLSHLPPAPLLPNYGPLPNVNLSSIHSRKTDPLVGAPWDFQPRPCPSPATTSSGRCLFILFAFLALSVLYSAYLLVLGARRQDPAREVPALPSGSSSPVSSCPHHDLSWTQDEDVTSAGSIKDLQWEIAESSMSPQQRHPGFGNHELEIAFDYALSSLGARVLTTRDTKPIALLEAKFLGFSVYSMESSVSMEDAPLEPLVIPGRCWRFREFPGTLVIQLPEEIWVSSFSLSHVLALGVPANRLRSAPQHFEVWGLTSVGDERPHLFGAYTFQLFYQNPTQAFAVQYPAIRRLSIVELKILSNHGAADFTCVYRFKVFGVAAEDELAGGRI